VGDDDPIAIREPGDLPHGEAKVLELLLHGSHLALADEGIAPQRDQENLLGRSVETEGLSGVA